MAELTDNQKLLLATGMARGEKIGDTTDGKTTYKNAIVHYEDAEALWKDKAHDNLVTLVFKGFIDTTDVPGRFKVLNAPQDVHDRADVLREKRHEREKARDLGS